MTFARGQSGSKRATTVPRAGRAVGAGRRRLVCEALEDRRLLSAASNGPSLTELESHLADPLAGAPFAHVGIEVFGSAEASPLALTGAAEGYTPSQIRHAYGFDQIYFSNGGVVGDGTGQTIAIIVAYHSPTIEHDLAQFDAAFGIPAPPSFTVIDQSGGTLDPKGQGTLNWEAEAALDVEWTHAMAPGANIVLIEAAGTTFAQLVSNRDPLNPTGAVETARTLPGVSVISMSWGSDEFSTETNYDTKFTTPSGHTGITFVAATGDNGSPGTYPAYSPNVLAVGGTALVTDAAGNITIESGWGGSGGGISQFESHPSYQTGVVTQSTTKRTMPDVALDADPSTSSDTSKGIPIYDSYNNGTTTPWNRIGGTSFSAPVWSSLIAIANQGRALSGLAALNGRNDTLPLLYSMSSSNFNDITSGSNGGFSAGAGYDLVTGRGTPRANLVVAGLIGRSATGGQVFSDTNGNGALDSGEAGLAGWTVYQDLNGNGSYDPLRVDDYDSTNVPKSITHTTITSTIAVAGTVGRLVDVNVSLNISHGNDSDLVITLISPLGTRITLANRVGGSGDNFTNTTFDNTAALPIASGSAPFSGTYKPSGSLGALFGADANGTWTLEIQDVVTATNGLLNNWSLAITSGDPATLTNSSGAYQFIGLPAGTFTTREVVQAVYTQTSPSGGFYSTPVSGTNVIAGLNFGNQPQPSATPGSVTLLSASDTGVSDSDLITRLNNAGPGNALQFSVAGTIAGATITILSNGTPIGSATASGTTTLVTTNGFITLADGAHDITARQTEPGKSQSASTAPLVIQVDTQAPVLSLVPVSPDPRTAPVSQMTIAFDEWITGLELGDLALKLNGGVNLLSGAQSVASGDGATWTLGDLTAITTAAGAYQLLVAPAGAPITDRAGNVNTFAGSTSFTVQPAANSTVLDRRLFYNQSAFDDGTAAISLLDKNAIATDKSAYLPDSGVATFSSVSSYTRGINGIIIDISGSHTSISAADFVFKVGNNNQPGSWAAAPTPSAIAVLSGEGTGGSDRVEITWASGSIKNQWLEVQVLATANTGLAATDVFFWGNKIADSGTGSPANLFQTDSTDAAQVFATLTSVGGASITNPRDYNRSGAVDSTDAAIVFATLGTITRIDVSSGSLQGGGSGSDGSLDDGGAQPATSLAAQPTTAPMALLPATTPPAQSTPGDSRAIGFGPWSDRASAAELRASFGPHESGGLASLAATAHWWQSAEGGSSAAEFDAFDDDLFELLATGRHAGTRRR